ncbi:hypothetical protein GCM10023093_05810 [Nemorincola caseinilytica]|uniref:histidine kinase n=1 Tax=Nemorincola caseinilytica TaxID=2054315 RepID=A0ABP8N4U0_9BACT
MKLYICLFISLLCAYTSFSQVDISALKADLKNQKSIEERIEIYRDIYNYYQHSQPDSASYYANMGLQEFKAKKSKNGIASMTVLLAFMNSLHGRIDMARQMQEEAIALFREVGNKRGIASALNGIGVLEGRSGNFRDATKHFMEALKYFEELHDTDGIVNTYMKIGVVNEKNDIMDKALDYYNKALNLMGKKEVKGTDVIYLYNNIGIVYAKMGNLELALPYFERALAGSNKPEKTGIRIQTLNNLGIVFDKYGDYKKSLAYFDEALKITQDKNMPEDFARISVSRSGVIGKTQPEEAIKTLKEALKVVQELGLRSMEPDIYDAMVEQYNRMGKHKEAFDAMATLKHIEDSLESKEKAKEIMDLQSVHELERSNAQLALAEEKNESNRLIRNIIIGVAIGFAVLFIAVLLLYRKTNVLNRRLSRRENELQKTNDMKDKLFSIIGHDLRGPIGNVPVMLQILEDSSTSKEEQKYLIESLIAHTQASAETLDKLLYWGQAQIKGIGMKQSAFAVDDAVQNNLSLISITAKQKQISIVNNIAPGTKVFADPAHFDFVIRNLLSNALKFTHNGGTVTLGADTRQKAGHVVFSVTDDGIGINAQRQQEIFKPFASSTRGTADEKGTSIGLMLCKEFVNENGGDIWVTSEENKGSTFYFSLKASA